MKSADAGVELTVILCWNNNPLIAPIKSVAAPSSIDRNLDDISSPKASNWSVGTADLGRFGVLGEVALELASAATALDILSNPETENKCFYQTRVGLKKMWLSSSKMIF